MAAYFDRNRRHFLLLVQVEKELQRVLSFIDSFRKLNERSRKLSGFN